MAIPSAVAGCVLVAKTARAALLHGDRSPSRGFRGIFVSPNAWDEATVNETGAKLCRVVPSVAWQLLFFGEFQVER